jgi:hypothetical protein
MLNRKKSAKDDSVAVENGHLCMDILSNIIGKHTYVVIFEQIVQQLLGVEEFFFYQRIVQVILHFLQNIHTHGQPMMIRLKLGILVKLNNQMLSLFILEQMIGDVKI